MEHHIQVAKLLESTNYDDLFCWVAQIEDESAGESDGRNDCDYESESEQDSAGASGGRDDEELARELDFQLNQNSRPRPTRRAARRANRRLQVGQKATII